MINAFDNARPAKSTYIGKAVGLLVVFLTSAAGFAADSDVDSDSLIVDRTGGVWICESGHRLQAGVCVEVIVPDNAYATNRVYGDVWMCNRGYRRDGDACIQFMMPEHAYLNSPRGHDWRCNPPYRKRADLCVAP